MARLLGAGIGVILLGLAARAADPPDRGADRLDGKWLAVEGTRDGKALTGEELARFKIILDRDGGRTGWQDPFAGGGDRFHNLTIRLDRTTSPGRLNLIRQIGLKGTTYPGIFKLDGDRLIVCWNLEPWASPDGPAVRPVPKGFTAPAGSGLTLLVFKKSKE